MVAGLRESHRQRTRRVIQEHAVRLFREKGFDHTTVAEVAAAADVSSMTVFRYFQGKEDLVLADEYDPLIIDRVTAVPATEAPMKRVAAGLTQGIDELSVHDLERLLGRLQLIMATPALRARLWDNQYATQQAIVGALRGDSADPEHEFRLAVGAGACLAAAAAALARWVDQDGRADLRTLMVDALAIVAGDIDPRRAV